MTTPKRIAATIRHLSPRERWLYALVFTGLVASMTWLGHQAIAGVRANERQDTYLGEYDSELDDLSESLGRLTERFDAYAENTLSQLTRLTTIIEVRADKLDRLDTRIDRLEQRILFDASGASDEP